MRLFLGLILAVSAFAQQPVTQGPRATTTAAWLVDGTGGVFPVTGTFWQATQPVSGTFWQATQPVSGTFFQATQPVSVADGANVVLGSKADAKSTATDTTAITIMQVLKEISAMEQAPASRAVTNAGTFEVQATIGAGSAVIGHVITDATSVTTATLAAETTKVIGTVNQGTSPWIVAGGGTAGSAATGVVTIQGIASMTKLLVTPDANSAVNVAQINGVTPLMGNGATGTGALRVSIANDSTGVVQPGNTANTTPWLVQNVPGTTNGLSFYVLEPVASDNHAVIKAGAGTVYHISATNKTGTVNYLRLYNATTGFNGCNSATNLQWELVIPASAAGAVFVEDISQGIAFDTGVSICVSGAYGQTSTTNATASAMSISIGYK